MNDKCINCGVKIEPIIKIAINHKEKDYRRWSHYGPFCKKHAIEYLEAITIEEVARRE